MKLKEEVKDFPKLPGVYIIRSRGEVIYVGKSACLRDRVKSYFSSTKSSSVKTKSIRSEAEDIDYIVTDTELDALVLEENLIKEYRPKYNVLLKDNKRYPYLKITDEKFPQLVVTRKRDEETGQLFGPYTDAAAMRETLDTLEKTFPIRDCSWKPEDGPRRPCLRYHIDLCPAPCAGNLDRDEYLKSIQQIRDLLKGKTKKVSEKLKELMDRAAKRRDYEKAAEWRDKLQALQKISRGQSVRLKDEKDRDFIALSLEGSEEEARRQAGTIQVFFVRSGRISGQDNFPVEFPAYELESSIIAGFIKKFYANKQVIPAEIYLEEKPEDASTIEKWLANLRSGPVEFVVPQRGEKRKILQMAKRNAAYSDVSSTSFQRSGEGKPEGQGAEELKQALDLPAPPKRIEGYDISNISGTDAVGSMVVFENGNPKKDMYRRFRVKGKDGPDDYAMLKEVLRRRFLHGSQEGKPGGAVPDESFSRFPDLVLIDGGKGQVSACRQVMDSLSMGKIPISGLAKEDENVYLPGRSCPLGLKTDSEGLRLLKRIRDEAHRFAINYHRRLRQKRTVRSSLDSIRGVGPKRKKTLLGTFDSIQGVGEASLEELKEVPGLPEKIAKRVYRFFREESQVPRPNRDK